MADDQELSALTALLDGVIHSAVEDPARFIDDEDRLAFAREVAAEHLKASR